MVRLLLSSARPMSIVSLVSWLYWLLYRKRDHNKLFSIYKMFQVHICAVICGALTSAFNMRSTLCDFSVAIVVATHRRCLCSCRCRCRCCCCCFINALAAFWCWCFYLFTVFPISHVCCVAVPIKHAKHTVFPQPYVYRYMELITIGTFFGMITTNYGSFFVIIWQYKCNFYLNSQTLYLVRSIYFNCEKKYGQLVITASLTFKNLFSGLSLFPRYFLLWFPQYT